MGKGSKAPAPDPRMGEAAARQVALAERQYSDYMGPGGDRDWLRGVANEALGISRETNRRTNALSDYQLESMRFNDNRYRTVGIPFEDELLSDVRRFDSPAYKNEQIAMAMGDVQNQFQNAEGQRMRGLQRRGVNPNSGNYQQASRENAIAKASALASAASKTRLAADQVGLAGKMQMYGGMRGLAGLGNANASLATGALGLGQGAAGTMMGSATGSTSANNAAFNSAMGGMSAGIAGMGSYNSLQQNAVRVNNENDPWASIIGAGAQIGSSMIGAGWSDRRMKKNIVYVGKDKGTGLNVYEFEYNNPSYPGRYRGVMADEVAQVDPYAVIDAGNGFLAVNYERLGMRLVRVDGGAQ